MSQSAETLIDGIQRQISIANALLEAIRQEQLGLRKSDITALETAVAAKQRYVEALEHEQGKHMAILSDNGFARDLSGLENFLAECRGQQAVLLRDALDQLRSIARECRDENMRSSHLNVACKRRAQELLAIVRGESFASQGVYESNGAVTGTSSKPIARA
ncbi:MAG: flagellar protein FlgN [Gammaproteobacteria bacterium]|nr:flagellar protein FlgN [Gammaproteobacteria bacterium]